MYTGNVFKMYRPILQQQDLQQAAICFYYCNKCKGQYVSIKIKGIFFTIIPRNANKTTLYLKTLKQNN